MKKIINTPEKFITEMLEGIYAAHPDLVKFAGGDLHCLVSTKKIPGKVGIATGGGSGHLPLFLGYVGEGMLDGCSIGDVFQSPSAEQMLAVTKEIDSGAGVLYIYGNYGGDILNFDMAAEMADFEENIHVESVVAGEDVASGAPVKPGAKNTRRGVAGIFFVYKCAGAAAAKMLPLDEVKRVAEKVCENVRTMGVALTPCTVPRVGHPSFELAEDEMEIGMGIHGEPGIRRGKLMPADAIVDEMLNKIIEDLPYQNGDEVAILVNGLGATPLEEQYVMFRRIHQVLSEKGINIFHTYIGEYATSMEMAGASISLLKVDDELKELLRFPADTPFFKQFKY
ncbi:dihydroxyacetone kinase subunit DhaK [Flexilinea flocculi]|jgi:dihydroxyacetone kinase-like protein|uniref:phosphoenolpyruvate--glycerone phosphotransferase n=1 Tax=Flexilinea flocculi TaxID=1678840 RepID=A0A0S7BV24_9CHLR|nr:dihydroxyacetone kinase subunit DhaK [Flexilinea flocculi]GAP40207.1 dihydroxyacetone kinase [Flexilinea flocculi]